MLPPLSASCPRGRDKRRPRLPSDAIPCPSWSCRPTTRYREVQNCWYVVWWYLFLLLLNSSAWLCLGPASQDLRTLFHTSVHCTEHPNCSFFFFHHFAISNAPKLWIRKSQTSQISLTSRNVVNCEFHFLLVFCCSLESMGLGLWVDRQNWKLRHHHPSLFAHNIHRIFIVLSSLLSCTF